MKRAAWAALGLAVAVSGGAFAAPPTTAVPAKRPPVDEQAMREAMRSAGEVEEDFASSASYAHFLRSRLHHFQGDHKRALDELRLSLVSDESNAYLLVAVAEEYARMSELDRSEKELRKVIDTQPGYAPAQLMMGRVLMESRKYTRARVHLKRAVKLKPHDADAYLALAQLHLELQQLDEATKVVEEMSIAVPTDTMGLKRLGMAFAERGESTRAERLLRKASERNPTDSEIWSALAQLHETAGRNQEAADAYAQALLRQPDDRELLLSAGRLALKMGDDVSAKAWFDSLLGQTGEPELWVKVAFAYLASRRMEGAAEVLDHARKLGVGEPRLAFYAGLVHARLRRFDRAAEAYGEVPTGSELFHEARLQRGMALSSAGHHQKAIDLFKAGIAEKPDYLLLYPAYSRALELSGNPREAETLLLKKLKEKPGTELFEAVSQLYLRQGRAADAVELLGKASKDQPTNEALLMALGAAYERKGDVEKSLERMRAVLAMNPDNAAALNFIGYTLADRNRDIDEAEKLVTRALQLRPDEGAYLDSLGWVYFRRGDYSRAVETLQRATEISPDEPLILEHLGDAYLAAARLEEAQSAFRRALQLLEAANEKTSDARVQKASLQKKLKTVHAGP